MSKEKMNTDVITISAEIDAPIEKVWEYFTEDQHIVKWNNASPDWHTPVAKNDLNIGGTFLYRMESRDGKIGFDFEGTYEEIQEHKLIIYFIADGRKVIVRFDSDENTTTVTETFEPEEVNSFEMQRSGWQAILNNFKEYVENN